jgi:hypothetical protein
MARRYLSPFRTERIAGLYIPETSASMKDTLRTYLHDHLAGSNFAVELLKSLRDQHTGEPLGSFAEARLIEVQQDREILQQIVDRVGQGSIDLKEAAAWVGEKLSQVKLRRDHGEGLGTFEALETLVLGIPGKASLWRALSAVSDVDTRVRGFDFDQLAARAAEQHAKVEECRPQVARRLFVSSP